MYISNPRDGWRSKIQYCKLRSEKDGFRRNLFVFWGVGMRVHPSCGRLTEKVSVAFPDVRLEGRYELICCFPGLFLQLPKDGNGLVTMILTCLPSVRPNARCQPQTDWACILLSSNGVDLENLLAKDPFPNDYTRMPADFMILPVSLFRWRVELLVEELENLTRNVVNEEEQLISAIELSELDSIRKSIFELGKVQLRLRRKWVCTLEVATTLSQYFDAIERKYAEEEVSPRYSEILRQRVRMDSQLCGSLEYDLQIIPSKIDSQRQMV